MSKNFLTESQAIIKLGLSGGGDRYVTKSNLIAMGNVNTDNLSKYHDDQYPVDDDIVKEAQIPYYTLIYIPNIDLGIYYRGYSNWAYSFNMSISNTWRQYFAILIADKNLLDQGYNIKGNLNIRGWAAGK